MVQRFVTAASTGTRNCRHAHITSRDDVYLHCCTTANKCMHPALQINRACTSSNTVPALLWPAYLCIYTSANLSSWRQTGQPCVPIYCLQRCLLQLLACLKLLYVPVPSRLTATPSARIIMHVASNRPPSKQNLTNSTRRSGFSQASNAFSSGSFSNRTGFSDKPCDLNAPASTQKFVPGAAGR